MVPCRARCDRALHTLRKTTQSASEFARRHYARAHVYPSSFIRDSTTLRAAMSGGLRVSIAPGEVQGESDAAKGASRRLRREPREPRELPPHPPT